MSRHASRPDQPSFPLGDQPTPATPTPPAKEASRYPIPAGARRATCSGETCGAVMYWTPEYRFPLSCAPADCYAPTPTTGGRGISHYVDCPDRGTFGRNAARPDRASRADA